MGPKGLKFKDKDRTTKWVQKDQIKFKDKDRTTNGPNEDKG